MDGIPIRAAAQRLGVSVESLRKRAQRGTITAYKVDGDWFIVPPAEQDDRQDAVPDTGQGGDVATGALVDQLTFMQRELERRDLEIERLTGMLAESQRTVRLLLPASAGHGQDVGRQEPAVGVPQAPERPGDDESRATSGNTPHSAPQREIAASQPRPWWRRLLDLG